MKRFFYTLFVVLAFVACSESDVDNGGTNSSGQTPSIQPEITLSNATIDFSTDGGSNVVTFTSSEAWTAQVVNSRADDWCSIEPSSGPAGSARITVTTTENDTPDDRTASIIIKAGTTSKTINVSQKQKDALTVTSSKFEVSAEGGEVSIEVKANIDFEYAIEGSAADWVEYKATRALKTSNLVFEIKENDDTDKREAKITITSGELSEVVTIYQEGNEPTIIISQNKYSIPSAGETIAVEVKSNVDVAIEMPDGADWIAENITRATSTNTYYFDIDTNEEYDNRTAEIKFTNKENKLSETVTITQLQRDAIVVAESEYFFYEDGGELDFEINTNLDVEVSISQDAQSWIKQVDTRGLQSKELHFDIATNNSDNDREGIISIIGGDITQRIIVRQANFSTSERGHNTEPYFSETVELMGLLWRLAGAEEFNKCQVSSVANSADSYFAPFKNHKAVELAKQYKRAGFGNSRVAQYGIQIIINNKGEIIFDPDYLEGSNDSFESWGDKRKNDMLAAVNDFYKESKFHDWFLSTLPEQEQAIASFMSICNFDYTWLDSFYGNTDKLSSRIILNFMSGTGGFGNKLTRKDGTLLLSPVIGSLRQENGVVRYANDVHHIVHEFSHPFCNPLIDAHWNSIARKVNEVFYKVSDILEQSYPDAYHLIKECLVRASVIRYMISHNNQGLANQRLALEESRGFLFVRPIVKALEKREKEADKYPTLADFMPEIVTAINNFDPDKVETAEPDTLPKDYVDLGIEMGDGKKLYFATRNVGETSPAGFGTNVYCWGAVIEGGKAWISDTGMWPKGHKLDAAHDIATITWGEKWHTPSIDEWTQLAEQCDYERKEADESGYGVAGYFFYNKADHSKFIFLPVSPSQNELMYWTSEIADPYNGECVARCFRSYLDYNKMVACGATMGLASTGNAVRPVFVE
ncbi:MAG: DUF4932 domain-containing protein [Alistipes sp.]|nr:DUF4932 domain-containing protein [Alistipes sp.]